MKESVHWLNRERLTIYPRIFVALFLVAGLVWIMMSNNMIDKAGHPLGSDFIQFWAASHIILSGHPENVYNISMLSNAQQIAVPGSKSVYAWLYPPSFLLIVLPLALLPYIAAYWIFILSTLSAYIVTLRRIVRGNAEMWCVVAFSGLWVNLVQGQNAFLTAAIAGAALLRIEKKPVIAGLFIGLLAIKPHLAILFPVALIAIGAWRTLITAAVTAIMVTAMSTAMLGIAVFRAFLANMSYARIILENDTVLWTKMTSLFACLRLLGIPVEGAYVIHTIVAVVSVIAVWRVWSKSKEVQLRGAALMTATFLVSPYSFDYDLAWLAFPISWLAMSGLHKGWLRGEREVLVAAWLLPMLIAPIAKALSVQMGPIVLCALLWMTVRRSETASLRTLGTDVMPVAATAHTEKV